MLRRVCWQSMSSVFGNSSFSSWTCAGSSWNEHLIYWCKRRGGGENQVFIWTQFYRDKNVLFIAFWYLKFISGTHWWRRQKGLDVLYSLWMHLKFSVKCIFLSAFPRLMIQSYSEPASRCNTLAWFFAMQNTVIFQRWNNPLHHILHT